MVKMVAQWTENPGATQVALPVCACSIFVCPNKGMAASVLDF